MADIKLEKIESNLPVIAIVGRPNVGKSSIFNSIIGRRLSIVHEQSGVTRDRVVSPVVRNNCRYELIDTGGLGTHGAKRNIDMWDECIAEQVETAIEGADVLIFVVNVQDGIVALDESVAKQIRSSNLPVIVAANKADNKILAQQAVEFSALGFDTIIPVSSLHRSGIEELFAEAAKRIDKSKLVEDVETEIKPLRIAIAGRPNVGKSSLVNALLGEERVIVSDQAGTTRDAIDIDFNIIVNGEERPAVLIDTAGLRRRGKVDTVVEYFSTMRSEAAINNADLVIFMVEASKDGVTAQDKKIAAMIKKSGRACIIAANKLDLCDAETKRQELLDELEYTLYGMNYAPVVFMSVKERRNIDELLNQIIELSELSGMKIPTSLVNKVVLDAYKNHTPPVVSNSPLKIYYASMIKTQPPTFLIFVNQPKYCADNYLTFLRNTLREAFDFSGSPIEIELRARPKKVMSFHTVARNAPSSRPQAEKKRKARERSLASAGKLSKTKKAPKSGVANKPNSKKVNRKKLSRSRKG